MPWLERALPPFAEHEAARLGSFLAAAVYGISIKSRLTAGGRSFPRQLVHQPADYFAKALVATQLQKLVRDLLKRIMINVPSQYLRDLADGIVRHRRHQTGGDGVERTR